jgi:hypothetical protein
MGVVHGTYDGNRPQHHGTSQPEGDSYLLVQERQGVDAREVYVMARAGVCGGMPLGRPAVPTRKKGTTMIQPTTTQCTVTHPAVRPYRVEVPDEVPAGLVCGRSAGCRAGSG